MDKSQALNVSFSYYYYLYTSYYYYNLYIYGMRTGSLDEFTKFWNTFVCLGLYNNINYNSIEGKKNMTDRLFYVYVYKK